MKDICTQFIGMPEEALTTAQQELYDWLVDFIGDNHHSPSIRQMMQAMGLKSPAPIQSRLRHLQQKGWIKWQEGQARTLQLIEESISGVPVLGAIAAGGSARHPRMRKKKTRRARYRRRIKGRRADRGNKTVQSRKVTRRRRA